MPNLNISISDLEYQKFGIKDSTMSFTDLINLIRKELTRQNLNKSIELAEKYGLSALTMDEITNEVKAVRQDAKNRN